ncbi:hypothetical protein PYW07_000477 [Mythimna separata]|uniref:NADP-dependent oxidoreductase domain-containing protein n=1 Tax=Mythimna separata TaxID=271217 RepID=A0AAD7Z2Y5_MYTSE|nr:hypothetical protein PYW07_000477 [Mythimna separata]
MASAVDSKTVDPKKANKFVLNNGHTMPAVGLGTYRMRDQEEVLEVVNHALAAGYRMFDTAAVYRNESFLKEAFRRLLPRYDLDRDDIFITTKLSPAEHGRPEVIKKAYANSLENLGTEYIDMYLVHFPGSARIAVDDKKNTELRHATWESMVELYDAGKVNGIGVSNFTNYHLELLMERNHGVVPAVNQVEWHPFYYQTELLDYCKANDIVLQAYCSLGGKSVSNNELLLHPSVTKIAQTLGVTNAQVLLKWARQQNVAIIPKSTNPVHIKQNISLNFEISPEDMRILNNLNKNPVKYAWDPRNVV